jgi:hypothetical protein
VTLPSGRIVGDTDRVVHLFPLPTGGRSLTSSASSAASLSGAAAVVGVEDW